FRSAQEARRRSRSRIPQYGNERRFRNRNPLRRDPGPGRHRHLRPPPNRIKIRAMFPAGITPPGGFRMPIRLTSVAICTALSVAGLLAGLELRTPSVAAPAEQTKAPPPDTAVLRAQYEKW